MKLKTIVIPIFLQVTLILINVSGLNINTSYSSTHNTYSSREKNQIHNNSLCCWEIFKKWSGN